MKFLTTCKDGGAESTVWAHILFEIKALASVMLLRFENGSRDAYHSHAFNCVSWVLSGELHEHEADGTYTVHRAGLRPIITLRSTTHKVVSRGRTWVVTFRGPWTRTWKEILPGRGEVQLTNGRREVVS
ncbi:MAG TPA: hypothetical protein VGK73_16115 [Polyangiaceae bacterium]